MTQTSVRQQVAKEKLAERSKELYDSLVKEKRSEDCEEMARNTRFFKDALNDPLKIPKDKRAYLLNMSDEMKKYFIDFGLLYDNLCRKKSVENMQKIRDFVLKDEASTCRVSSNSWKEVFQRVAPSFSESDLTSVWVTKSAPSGECGMVQLNRFETVGVGESTSKFKMWNYTARKAVTNPAGVSGFGQCKDRDEGTYLYSWISRDLFVDCRKIKFSAF
jgi:hypothetical protein